MSTTVDKRVVEIDLKNQSYESHAKQSIKTTEQLQKSLEFESSSKGLKNLNEITKDINLEGISDALKTVSSRFTSLGIMGVTALQNIANSAYQTGKRIVESLTIDPVMGGFREYETKMGSVQTIMAGTGESLETVMAYLEELNAYSDKTIYSFADMTNNIGKFTNAGVSLDKAVAAIKGVSNEAAISGANANEASRAMYNFAQALSAGFVKLIDWKSIENANMATVEFKQNLIDTAVKIGTLTKTTDGMYETASGNTLSALRNFNDTLQDQWMTTDVLVETLRMYADETTDIGKRATAAASDVKTYTMLMDTLKEAAESGWAETFEIIIGDFNEAKELFTKLSDIFSEILGESARKRNSLLEAALGDSSKITKRAFHDVYDSVLTMRQSFVGVEQWRNVFIQNGYSADSFRQKLINAAVAAGTLEKAEGGLYKAGGKLIEVNTDFANSLEHGWLTQQVAIEVLEETAEAEIKVAEEAMNTLDVFATEFVNVAKKHGIAVDDMASDQENLHKIIRNGDLSIEIYDEVIDTLETKFANAAKTAAGSMDDLENATFKCGYSMQELKEYARQVWHGDWNNDPYRQGLMEQAGLDYQLIQDYVNWMAWGGDVTQYYWYQQLNLTDAQKESIDFTGEQLEAIKALREEFEKSGMSFEEFIDKATRKSGRELLVDSLFNIINAVKKAFGAVGDAFRDIFPSLGAEPLYTLIYNFEKLTEKLILTDDSAEDFRRTFRGVFAVIDIITKPLRLIIGLGAELIKWLGSGVIGLAKITGSIGDLLTGLNAAIDATRIFEFALAAIHAILDPIGDAIEAVFLGIGSVTQGVIEWANGNISLSETLEYAQIKTKVTASEVGLLNEQASIATETVNAFKVAIDWIKNAFSKLANSNATSKVADSFSAIGSGFKNAFSNIKNSFSSLGPAFDGFIAKVGSMGGVTLQNAGDVIREFFHSVVAAFSEGVTNFLAPIGDGFTNAFTKIKEAFDDLASNHPRFQSVVDFFTSFFDSLKNADNNGGSSVLTGFVNVFKGFNEGMGEVAATIGGNLKAVYDYIKEYFPALLAIVTSIILFRAVRMASDTVNGLVGIFEGIGLAADGVGKVVRNFAFLIKAQAFKVIAEGFKIICVSLIEVIAAIIALTFVDPIKLWNAVGILAAVSAVITAMVVVMGASAKGLKNVASVSSILLSLGVSMLLMAIALKRIAGIENIGQALIAFSVIFGEMIVALAVLSKFKAKILIGSKLISAFASALLIIAIAMKIIATMQPMELLKSMIVVPLLLAELGVIMTIFGQVSANAKVAVSAASTLLAFGTSLLLVCIAMKMIASMEPAELFMSMVVVTQLMAQLSIVIVASYLAGQHAAKAGMMLMGLSASLMMIGLAIRIIAGMDTKDLSKGIVAIGFLSIFISLLIGFSQFAGPNAAKAGIMLLAISAALVIIAGVIYILGNMDPAKAEQGMACISVIMALMMGLMAVSKIGAGGSFASISNIISLTAMVAALVGMVAILTLLDPVKLKTSTACLSILIGMMSLLMGVSKIATTTDIIKEVLPFTLMIAAITGAVFALSLIPDADTALKAAEAASLIIATMTGMMAVIGAFGDTLSVVNLPALSLQIGAGIDILVGMILVLLGGIDLINQLLNKYFDTSLETIISDALNVIQTLTDGIGQIIGSFVGSIAEGFTSHLIGIGNDLSVFAFSISGFFDVVGSINTDALDSLQKLVSAIFVLTASDFVYAITSLIGGPSFEEFGAKVGEFGDALKKFAASVADLKPKDLEQIDLAAGAIEKVANAFANIPTTGGVFEFFAGEKIPMDEFGTQLESFGKSLCMFSNSVSALSKSDLEHIETAAEASKSLVTLADTLPNTGGAIGFIVGNNDLDDFANQFPTFGKALVNFSTAISKLTTDDLTRISQVPGYVDALVVLADKIPNTGGAISFFTGDNDFKKFGTQLEAFGVAIGLFCDSIDDLSIFQLLQIVKVSNAVDPLVEMANKIPNSYGLINVFTGNHDFITFGLQLSAFGAAVTLFAMEIAAITDEDFGRIRKVSNAVTPLVEMANLLPESGGLLNVFGKKKDLDNFGSQLGTFGSGVLQFAQNVSGFTLSYATYCSNATTAVGYLANLTTDQLKMIESLGTLSVGWFYYNMNSIGLAIGTFAENVSNIDSKKFKTASDSNAMLVDIASSVVSMNVDSANSFGDSINAFADKFGEFIGKLDGFGDYSRKFNTAMDSFSSLMTTMSKIGSTDTTGVSAVVEDLSAIIDVVGRMSSTDTSNVKAFIDNVGAIGADGITEFVNSFDFETSGAENKISIFLGAVEDAMQSYEPNFQTVGGDFILSLKDGMTFKGPYATTKARTISTDIVSAFGEFVDEMENAGANFTLGVARGLLDNNSLTALEIAIRTVAEEYIIKNIKKKLDEHSPSKVAYGQGAYYTEGLINGLNSLKDKVGDASSDISKSVVDNMILPVDDIDAILNSDFSSPVITPVLDLSMVREGASTINDIFNARRAVAISAGLESEDNTQDIVSELRTLVNVGNSILSSVQRGGDIYLDEKTIIGRINRRLGTI